MRLFNKYGFSLASAATISLGKLQWDLVESQRDKEKKVTKAVQRFLVCLFLYLKGTI